MDLPIRTVLQDSELEVCLMSTFNWDFKSKTSLTTKHWIYWCLVKSCLSIFCMIGTSYWLNGFSLKCYPNRTKTASNSTRMVFKTLVLTINHPSYETGSYNWNVSDTVVMTYKGISLNPKRFLTGIIWSNSLNSFCPCSEWNQCLIAAAPKDH